ncbi:hypothetical protein MBLNU13_g08512t1 [Cladosporium sp. NU13]
MAGTPVKIKRSCENGNENNVGHRPSKRPRYDYNDSISVLVDSEERRFVVHKDVICATSKFFKAACSASWKEGQEGIVRLPTVKPSVFEMYVDWLYFSEIASKVTGSLTGPLIDLFLLGDMVDDRNLRNKVMDALQANNRKTLASPTTIEICRIWENTSERSMLRKWAFDLYALRSQPYFADHVAQLPSELVMQIAVRLMQQTTSITPAAFLARSQEYEEVGKED